MEDHPPATDRFRGLEMEFGMSNAMHSPFAYPSTVKHNHCADHCSKFLHFASQSLGGQVPEEIAYVNGL